MFISYNWLKELTATRLNPSELREALTNIGLAIDAVEERDGDFVLDVEVPSNRGDCLSHIGIAREVAVIENSRLEIPRAVVERTAGRTADLAGIEIRDPDLCPRYAARIVKGVKIGPSPEWLVKRLEVIGQRSINNVADITNYVLHETGQPLHAFDLAQLNKSQIIVRRAAKGESIKTLDGEERKLDSEMLVIADARAPVAIAGVMGGEDSEISKQTTDILIESANFNPSSVRRTAKLLGLHTEASHRFERGVDPEGVIAAQERCVGLVGKLAGGTTTADSLDVYPKPFASGETTLRFERVRALTSLDVEPSETTRILKALGFKIVVEDSNRLTVRVPSWRQDVTIEEDLVEEVARHTGFNSIRSELPPAHKAGQYHFSEPRKRSLRRALADSGFDEAINLSFVELTTDFDLIPSLAAKSGEENAVTLTNPIMEESARMRQTLLPGLLESIRRNLNHGIRDVCLFELGRLFAANDRDELPTEREGLGLAATGNILFAERAQPESEFGFFDLKGALESSVLAMNLPPLEYKAATIKHLRTGQSATLSLNGTRVGSMGRLSETVAAQYKFRQPVYVAELDLTTLIEAEERPVLYKPLPRYPSIIRDVSMLLNRRVTFADLQRSIQQEVVPYFVALTFVGTYEGEGISDDSRSITLRFEYRADDRTLRDEEVDESHWTIVRRLQENFKAEIR